MRLPALLLPLALSACVVVGSEEPWAPLELQLEQPFNGEVWVYVDEVYRGNFVGTRFRIYLTEGLHVLRVHLPGDVTWQRELSMTAPPRPVELVVRPGSAE